MRERISSFEIEREIQNNLIAGERQAIQNRTKRKFYREVGRKTAMQR